MSEDSTISFSSMNELVEFLSSYERFNCTSVFNVVKTYDGNWTLTFTAAY